MLHCLNDLSNDCIQPFSWLLGVHLYLPCIGRANRLWVGSEALVLLATPSCGSVRATMARSAMVLRTTLVRSTSFLEKTRSAEGRTVVLRTPYRSPGEEGARTVCPLGSLPHAAPWPPWRPTPPPDRCVLRRGQPPARQVLRTTLVLAHPTVGGSLRSPPSANALSTECLFRSTREQPHLVDPPPCELLITTSNLC